VYNEEATLEKNIRELRRYLDNHFPFDTLITIADNASDDGTLTIAKGLSRELQGVNVCSLPEKGRGRALRTAWLTSKASVVAYMDVDLSTGLDALLPLVAPLLSGHSDVAIGSRLAKGSKVVRGPKRELISRSYNLIVRAMLRNGFSDAQCGFKAMRKDAAEALLPLVTDNGWFFDTELLVLAERNGLRIHEVPVDWVDDPNSSVHLLNTAIADLKGLGRLIREFGRGGGRLHLSGQSSRSQESLQLFRFARVGLLSTLAYFALFFALSPFVGIYIANVLVLLLCTAGNIAAHGRFTFASHVPVKTSSAFLGGVLLFATNLGLISGALAVASAVAPGQVLGRILAIVIGTLFAALVRFILLRAWVFRTFER
jgi:glycosyltransferase involved in cell wall biosynthesis